MINKWKDPELIAIHNKKYYAKNADKIKAQHKKYYAANADKRKAYQKKYNEKRYIYISRFINRVKLFKGCLDCGFKKYPEALDFDHILGEKKWSVSAMTNCSKAQINTEIRKCVVRCSNCHRHVTKLRKQNREVI